MKSFRRFVLVILLSALPLAAQHEIESHPVAVQAAEYASEGKYADAIATIGKLIELNSNESVLLLARAQYHKGAGNLVSFRKDLDQAAALAPNDISILIGIERTLGGGNREGCERVLAFADSHYSKFTQSSAILGIRSRAKNCLGDTAGSFNDISLAVELDPENTTYRANRARALERLGSSQQALDLLHQLIDALKATLASSKSADEKVLAGHELTSAYSARAGIFERNGENESALLELSKAIELGRREHDLRTRIDLYKKMGRLAEAAADISANHRDQKKQSDAAEHDHSPGPG